MSVVVCTDLSSKEPYRQACMGRVVISGRLGGVMVSTQAKSARDVGSIPLPGPIFPIFIMSTYCVNFESLYFYIIYEMVTEGYIV